MKKFLLLAVAAIGAFTLSQSSVRADHFSRGFGNNRFGDRCGYNFRLRSPYQQPGYGFRNGRGLNYGYSPYDNRYGIGRRNDFNFNRYDFRLSDPFLPRRW